MTLNVPALTSVATVSQQSGENRAVANSSPSGTYLTGALKTFAGEVDVSQQLLDRSGPAVTIDQVVYSELQHSLEMQADSYVLSQALADAGTVTNSRTFSVAGLWQDIQEACSQMQTASGVVLPATHCFVQPDFGRWALSQSDPNGRPLALPTPVDAPVPTPLGEDGRGPQGHLGVRVLDLPLFTDGSIPSGASSTTQIVLANMPSVYTLVTEPVCRAVPEPLAADLEVAPQCYALVGTVVKHDAAIQIVGGSAYPASPTWT
jgi:hypothetical protein